MSTASTTSSSRRRAARIKQIREKQSRVITPRNGGGGGGDASSVASSADDNVGAVIVDVGSALLSSERGSGGGSNGGGGGDASSVASSKSRTRGQKAAAYRARKAAKAAPPPPPSVAAAHHHPPIHPPTAGSGSGGGGRAPSPSPHAQMMQIDSVMSSASDVVSTASHHTTSSQMTAKAANTPQGRERSSSSSRARPSSSNGERRSRSVSVPRASSSRRSASPSPARPSSSSNGGGSRSASLRKLRSENPSLLPSRGSATTTRRPSSVGRSRSRSVEPSGRYDDQAQQQQQQQPPTPPTPVETIRLGHDSSPPTSDIDSCDVTSPSSPLSASSSKSEHLSVEKGIRLLQNIESTHKTTDASPSPRPASRGRAPSPFRRHNNSGSNTPTSTDGAPSSSPAPSPRPDPPRESPTPSRKTAWDRAQRAVEAQMDAPHSQEEVGRAPPMEPEEVTEIPPPSPRQPPTQTRASPRHHQPDEAASVGAPAMLLSPDQEEARLQAEEEIRHLEARASVMKQQMERQAEILVRQEAEIMHTTDPTAVYGQGYLPPNLPPTPQFSQYDYNDPAAPQQVASFQQPSAPVPPLPNDPYSPQSPARMNAAMPSYQSSSSQMMQQRGYSSSPNAPPSPLMHPQGSSPYGAPPMTQPQPAPAYHPQQQHPYGMEQQQHAAPAPQDYGMHYQSQPPHLQLDAVESFRAQEQQSKYREYTLSPASQGAPTPTGSSPYHHGPQMTSAPQPPPAQQYHHQQGGAYPSAQQGLGFTAEPIVSHMHHQSRNEMHTYEEATRETSQSMAVNPNVQSAYGSAGPREGSEANMSEPSFDPSSISHLTQSTYRTVSQHQHPHPHEQQPATIPSASDGTPGQSAPSPRPVAPVLSPEAFKSAPTSGFESDSESDFDNPTFSPQSADIKSNGPSVTSKAISEAGKSGSSWWKEPFDDSPGAVGKKDKALQSVAESHFDSDGFPVPETMPPPPVATMSPTMSKSVRTSSTVHRPVRLPSPAMNSVASGQASHFTAASAATADSLGRRLAAKLNINPDDDEDVFSGLEDGTVLPSASTRPASKSHDDIFYGVASPGASPTDASHKAASKANISLASRTSSGVDLNTVDGEGRKALMDDVTSFGGSASFVANKRPPTNTSTHNQSQSLNLEYSVSTPAEGVLGMEQDEPKAAGLLGSGNGTARKSQFVMGMEDQNILEFEDAGTVTSDITSSIIDTGLTARKEAYEAYAATAAAPSVRYEPILEDDAESTNKSRASTSVGKHAMDQQENDNYEDEDTFDADVNTIDNTVDNTLDNTFDTAQSRRRGDKKASRRKGRKSRRQYESDSYSEDTYDDIGGSTVMTSTSGVSSGVDFFASFGCGVLDAIATQCAGHGRRPRSFDDRSLDDDLYNDEEGPSFDRTLDNSTLNNGTLGTDTVGTDLVDGGLSRKEQRRWDVWDKKDSATLADNASQSVASKSMGTVTHLEELEQRQQRAQHLERRARAQEKLLLNAYAGTATAMDTVEELSASVTPTSNTSSNAENKQPDQESRQSFSKSSRASNATGTRDALQPSPLKPESPLQIKPKPPSAPTGSKMLAAKSAIMQRQTLEKFCIRLKNQGLDVLKMNRDKKWQERALTVSKEVTYLSQGKNIFSGDRGHCPQGLLWAKKFNTKTREHSVADIDKTGKGGMLLSHLQGASLGNVADYPLSKKQLQGEFKDSVVVVLHTAEDGYPGNLRDVILRCRSLDDANFLLSASKAIAEILQRNTEAKLLSSHKGGAGSGSRSSSPFMASPQSQALSPRSPSNNPLWQQM